MGDFMRQFARSLAAFACVAFTATWFGAQSVEAREVVAFRDGGVILDDGHAFPRPSAVA